MQALPMMLGMGSANSKTPGTWTPFVAPMSDMTTPGDLDRQAGDAARAHEPAIIGMMSGYRPGERQSENVEDRRAEVVTNQSFPDAPQPTRSAVPRTPYPQTPWLPAMDEMLPQQPQRRRY